MKTGTMTLDEDGACFLPMEILQEVGWQPGERLIVESVEGVIRLIRADSPIGDARHAVESGLNEGASQPEK